jgi:hypothetical protein
MIDPVSVRKLCTFKIGLEAFIKVLNFVLSAGGFIRTLFKLKNKK